MVEHSRKQLKILIYKRNLPVKTKYHNYNCFTLVQFNQNCSIVIHVLRINGHCHRNQIFQRYSVPVRAEMAVNQLMLNLITRIINIASLSLRHSDPQIGPQVYLGPIKNDTQRFAAKIGCSGPILLFHGCYGTRISSPIHLATLQIPFQNLKWLKNAKY